MKNLLALFLSLSSFLITSAQDSLISPDKIVFKNNFFSFELGNGFNKSTVGQHYGPYTPLHKTGYVHTAAVSYTYNLSDKIGFVTHAGLCLFPFRVSVAMVDSFIGTSWDSYPMDIYYRIIPFAGEELILRQAFSKKVILNSTAGVRVFAVPEYNLSTGSVSDLGEDYTFNMHYNKGIIPAFRIGAGFSYSMKKFDLLTLQFSYNYSLHPFYSGKYELYASARRPFNYSYGAFSNKGNFSEISIAYSFTRAKKGADLSKMISKRSKEDFNDATKIYKINKRRIPEHSLYFAVTPGLSWVIGKAHDKKKFLISSTSAEPIINFYFEQDINKNIFLETGFVYQEYFAAIRTRKVTGSFITSGFGYNLFNAYQISIGAGKRIIGVNLYNYVNLNAGMSLTITDQEKGVAGGFSFDTSFHGDTLIAATGTDRAFHTFFPLVFLGASKDLRIRGPLFFTISYRYNQGLLRVYESNVEYTSSRVTGSNYARITMKGSYHTVQIGLKCRLGSMWKKKVALSS